MATADGHSAPGTVQVRRTAMRTHRCGDLRLADAGESVTVCGWVAHRRQHGQSLQFLDLRDYSGVVQCVVDGTVDVRSEYVLKITGTVAERPEGTVNPQLATGEIELRDCKVEVLSVAKPPPFPLDDRADNVDESTRLAYRYLDLRRERMQRNLRVRSAALAAIRGALGPLGFAEVETPLLMPSTPEGAREFIVPSRQFPGSFYALPQSPQLFKQLLMVGGLDRYFQFARCLRDEDLRADRQYEFTQLDLEMSFVDQQDVLDVITAAVLAATGAVTEGPVPPVVTMTWHEAMDRYGVDKPDLRFGMELVELTGVFAGSGFKAFAGAGAVKGIRVPGGSASHNRKALDTLTDTAKKLGAKGLVWMRVGAGGALESPVAKFLSAGELSGIVSATGAAEGDLLLLVADEWMTACEVLGQLRNSLGRPPAGEGGFRFVWVVDFPLFVGVDKETGRPKPGHHPFTRPHPDDVDKLESDPLEVRSRAYDLVLNGWELGSGSIRIHEPELQQRIFGLLGISPEEANARFGFFLTPFGYGAPPHGGFAFGIDRLVAILAGEDNIREVIAFPKTQSGLDPMTGAPTRVDERQLRELGVRVIAPPPPA
ncbi:aspartate--tRNA ligase [Frankia sp. CNm7]|uniref:Aspartate--tRNA(Asp/Asn) ligase n=1 Tax=Frankia nepalensis TaxID=1836974 RepID=A0A937UWQ7_9ACTN|nr:aspartate--tRNA ligase [Frankia nepalensis]MBL7501721.1 aspartate--tRNA ligase [Frankia nepalensis]MBL7514247.1 aspartate--tRNA ligase [Frankia nepalensis]MBL7524819.1 aspartate--tRNA ligase [Frankia nepalensis]MBL7633646.1 aspartate--tRNA ligase [Frankia nepalensis]